LGNLSVENSLLIGVDLESCKHIDLLNQKRRCIFLSEFLSDGGQDACRVCVLVSFSIKLDCLHLLVLLYQMIGIALKELLYLHEVMLLSKFNCLVPLVQQYTAIDGLFDISTFDVALHCQLRDA